MPGFRVKSHLLESVYEHNRWHIVDVIPSVNIHVGSALLTEADFRQMRDAHCPLWMMQHGNYVMVRDPSLAGRGRYAKDKGIAQLSGGNN